MLKRINSKRSVYTKDFLPHYKVLVSLATIFHWIKDCLNFPEKDSFLPLDRLHTLRWATSYLLFCIYSRERVPSVSITLCCPKWCCSCSGIFYAPLSVLASVRSEFRLPLVCGDCFYPQQPHPFQFSSHHIGKLICLPRNALAVWYGSRSSWWVRIR